MATTTAPATRRRRPAAPPLDDPSLFFNRELSWLQFNDRVLAQVQDQRLPLLERVKFLAIYGSNLDEFCMIRVAGVASQVDSGVTRRSPDGRTPRELLDQLNRRIEVARAEAGRLWIEELVPSLAAHGIHVRRYDELDDAARRRLTGEFRQRIFPVLTPLAVDPGRPFPFVSNLSTSLAVLVRDPDGEGQHFARVKMPPSLDPFVPTGGDGEFCPLIDVIAAHLDQLFPGMEIVEASAFRVTRNADLILQEDEADDLLAAVEQELRRRRYGAVVRLEHSAEMSSELHRLLMEALDVTEEETHAVEGPLDLTWCFQIASVPRGELKLEPWTPLTPPRLTDADSDALDIFAAIRRRDVFLHHPYDDFSTTVEAFLEQAVRDPDVLAIKQTLYRTGGESPIVPMLIRAAEAGKQVVCLVELKARFDEAANIAWAKALENVGVHVVYGLIGLKTHVKAALVVRQEPDGIRRYVHIGTGNYNPKTARMYTDIGLLSCRPDLGADLTDLFNYLTGFSRQRRYRSIWVAPHSLRRGIIDLIAKEAAKGPEGRIRIKANSLVDSAIIQELYRASQAGVRIECEIRGICCLRPGLPGVSENIRVISVLGRFLEHSRIYAFGEGDDAEVWIGSADLMHRNLDNRVEIIAPLDDTEARREALDIVDIHQQDNVNAWDLRADGIWQQRRPAPGEEPRASQEVMMARALARSSPGDPHLDH